MGRVSKFQKLLDGHAALRKRMGVTLVMAAPVEEQIGHACFVRLLAGIQIPPGKRAKHCWLWQKSLDYGGYPLLNCDRRMKRATRLVYTLFHGEFDPALQVTQTCGDRRCLNPHHLGLLSTADKNRRLSEARQQSQCGEENTNCKLSDEQVALIRDLHVIGSRRKGFRSSDIAKRFGITRQHVLLISKGLTRKTGSNHD